MNSATPSFVGARLTEAREARQFTMVTLAELAGVSKQIVSEYEKGSKRPSAEVLGNLAKALGMPMSFFLKSFPPDDPQTTVFFRSMVSATLQARQRAIRRCLWLRRIVEYVRQFVVFPPCSLPDLGFSGDPRSLREDDIEGAAAELRRHWKLKDEPVPNMVGLIEGSGGFVVRQELAADKLDSLSMWATNDPQPYFVLGTDKASAVRSRFDAAHELGHIILHRRLPASLHGDPVVFRVIEDQAHRFAGAFLLPEGNFTEDFYTHLGNITAFVSLKSRWMVSIQAMLMRAKALQLITLERTQNLYRSLARQGWRLREPLDDVLLPEVPRLIQQAYEMVLARGIIDSRTLELHLGLPTAVVESVCGLAPGYLENVPPPVELKPRTSDSDDAPHILSFRKTS
jgi:Zn-dependent peptidase ImmA (M78 family)/DNA-binding XRE family transcriptional regulator